MTLPLFPARKPAPPRKLMRMCDAGEPGINLKCPRCKHDGGWWTDAAVRKGVPCPYCDGSPPPPGLEMEVDCTCPGCTPHCLHPVHDFVSFDKRRGHLSTHGTRVSEHPGQWIRGSGAFLSTTATAAILIERF